jgi:hypothetical protein
MADQVKKDAAPTQGRSHEQNRSIPRHSTSPSRSPELKISDDLILSLADAYENKRARQVGEWEVRQRAAAAF